MHLLFDDNDNDNDDVNSRNSSSSLSHLISAHPISIC